MSGILNLTISAASASDKSLIEELWDYIKDNWFTVNVGEYDNFNFGTGTLVSVRMIIIGICIGIVIAAIVSHFDRHVYGDFVRKLISEECTQPDKAKLLSELGYERNRAIRSALRSGHMFGKYVRSVGQDEYDAEITQMRAEYEEKNAGNKKAPAFRYKEYKYNLETDKFYIPKDYSYAADVKFDKAGSDWRSVIIVAIIAIVICSFVCFMLPEMLQLVDNFLSKMKDL